MKNIIFLVGSGMNSGKTTTAVKLVKGLLRQGLRVALCKLTGSVSSNDLYQMKSTFAQFVADFSDYGFPSTYLVSHEEIDQLFSSMMADASRITPDITVVEIADGILQQESQYILKSPEIRKQVKGIILSATCSLSALKGIELLRDFGHQVMGVTGIITNSPLYLREFKEASQVPIYLTRQIEKELSNAVFQHLDIIRH